MADIVCNSPDYASITPKQTAKHMRKNGYAVAGQGTTWDGITKALRHYGFKVHRPDSVNEFAKLIKKGNTGIMLMNARYAPDGTRWTSCGHYVACIKTKVLNGKRWFKMCDPGGRGHSGWYQYRKSMYGCIEQLWVADLKLKVPTVTLKKGTAKKKQVKWLQLCLNEALNINLKVDGIYGKATIKAVKRIQKKAGLRESGIAGPKTRVHMEEVIL